MSGGRLLIVNADDFGFSRGVNRGIIEAHTRGIVTSASLMVRWSAAAEAAAYARTLPELSVGLHVDLGEWIYRDDAWTPLYQVVPIDDAAALEAEVARQLTLFRRLLGCDPTHLDSHQHVHRAEPTRSVLADLGATLGVPVRHLGPTVRYCGAFYGQTGRGESFPEGIAVEALIALVRALPPGVTELCCHPGMPDELGETPYDWERSLELRSLCDPRVREEIARLGIGLCSFTHPAALVKSQPDL